MEKTLENTNEPSKEPVVKKSVEKDLRAAALEYHQYPIPGKISVRPTKGLTNQRDLALAYSPGVAYACDAIVADPATASLYTCLLYTSPSPRD